MQNKDVIQKVFSVKNKNPESVSDMFDHIAQRYDLMNDFMSFYTHKKTRKFALTLVRSKRPIRILDLATGTGDFAFLHARSKKLPYKEIIGLDFSRGMLRVGKIRRKKFGLEKKIKFMQGDIMNLPFKDNEFDLVTIGYGIRNVVDIPYAVKEIYRVIKPGGSFLVVEATPPLNKIWHYLVTFYFERVVTRLSKIFSSDPGGYGYFMESVNAFYNALEFTEKLKDAGFKKTRWYPQVLGSVTVFQGVKLP